MSKTAFKKVRKQLGLKVERTPLDTFAWPGGYVILYLMADGETMCPDCVNENIGLVAAARRDEDKQWDVVAQIGHQEGLSVFCCNCNKEIESDYGEPDEDKTGNDLTDAKS